MKEKRWCVRREAIATLRYGSVATVSDRYKLDSSRHLTLPAVNPARARWLLVASARIRRSFVLGGERFGRVRASQLRVRAGPEVRRPFTLRHAVVHGLYGALEIRGNRPELAIVHVAPVRPRHRRRQIPRVHREVA